VDARAAGSTTIRQAVRGPSLVDLFTDGTPIAQYDRATVPNDAPHHHPAEGIPLACHAPMTDADTPKSEGQPPPLPIARIQEALGEACARAVREALAVIAQELECSGDPEEARARTEAEALESAALSALRGPLPGAAPSVLRAAARCEQDAVALAQAADLAPYSWEARKAFFSRVRDVLAQGDPEPARLAIVDIVAAMFDYAVDHARVPEAAKPLLWRLQQPVVTLALLDSGYIGDEPRSLRRLVENLAAISVAFADDLGHGSELYRRLETVVQAVETVAEALHVRSAIIARQVEREYSRAARHVSLLVEGIVRERQALETAPGRRNRRDYSRRPSAERERAVTERIRELIAARLRADVPESVRQFLFEVWLRHLRTAALRNGEESNEFRVALQVVDDLIWSLDPSEAGSRCELAERIPPLIRLMTQGLREIGAKDDEYRAFFDELFLIHLRRMRSTEAARSGGPPADRTSCLDT
jgi:hypothetical protein